MQALYKMIQIQYVIAQSTLKEVDKYLFFFMYVYVLGEVGRDAREMGG